MVMNVVSVATSVSTVTLSWNHDGSGPPTQFNIERQVSGGGYLSFGVVPFTEGQASYAVSDGDAVPGVQYRVNAQNLAGVSDWVESNVPAFPPNPPTNVFATT